MATLFEIADDVLALNALLDELEGDISDPAVEAAVDAWFASIQADQGNKLENYVRNISQLEMEAKTAREEAGRYEVKARTRENRVAWYKERLKQFMERTGQSKVQTATGRTISVQANGGNPPLLLNDVPMEQVPARFKKTVESIDRGEVIAALKAGEEVPFAAFGERGNRVTIR